MRREKREKKNLWQFFLQSSLGILEEEREGKNEKEEGWKEMTKRERENRKKKRRRKAKGWIKERAEGRKRKRESKNRSSEKERGRTEFHFPFFGKEQRTKKTKTNWQFGRKKKGLDFYDRVWLGVGTFISTKDLVNKHGQFIEIFFFLL